MKKKLISILMCAMIGTTVIGCGSSDKDGSKEAGSKTESEADREGETQAIDKDFSLQMTDSYTFTDPQDIDFDQRFVLKGDESCKLLSDMANMGYPATAIYDIVYANDGAAAAEYQYFVAADEAGAASLAEFYTSQGQQITQEGNVIYAYTEGDTLKASIATMASMDTITEETVEAYIEMMKSFNGLVEYE